MRDKTKLLAAFISIAVVGLALLLYNRHKNIGPGVVSGSAAPRLKWQFATEGPIFSTPAIAEDGTVYVASYKFLYALNPDGSLKWRYFPGAKIHSSPLVGTGGEIYIGDQSCQIHALNPDGTKIWQTRLGTKEPGTYSEDTDLSLEGSCTIRTPPVLSGGIFYIANWGQTMFAVDASAGNTMKRFFDIQAASGSAAAVLPNGSLVQGTNSSLLAFDSNGNIQWAFRPEPFVRFGSPAVGSDGTIAVTAGDNKLHVLAADGGPKWEAPGAWVTSPLISNNGNIFIADASQLSAFSPEGKTLWQVPVSRASTPVIAANGDIYLLAEKPGTRDIRALAIDSNGRIKWSTPVGGWSGYSPSISSDGTVYFLAIVGSDGMVYAFQENNGGLSTGWPKHHGSLSNDGHPASHP